MSQLQQLKATIDSVAQGAKQIAGSLTSFKPKFGQQVTQVQSLIGGSSQRKDQEIISALQDAQSKVDQAAQALEKASKLATTFGQSL
jgi:uncharacterized phage infection (PIP) family protein YhgE